MKNQSNIKLETKTHAYDLHFENVCNSKFLCYVSQINKDHIVTG